MAPSVTMRLLTLPAAGAASKSSSAARTAASARAAEECCRARVEEAHSRGRLWSVDAVRAEHNRGGARRGSVPRGALLGDEKRFETRVAVRVVRIFHLDVAVGHVAHRIAANAGVGDDHKLWWHRQALALRCNLGGRPRRSDRAWRLRRKTGWYSGKDTEKWRAQWAGRWGRQGWRGASESAKARKDWFGEGDKKHLVRADVIRAATVSQRK
eukprot:scaffold156159_cov30-Tisochrysis_lutea.AAC.2